MAVATFGELLRRYRQASGLTQEQLAERAGLSAAGIAALESGRRRSARLSTVTLLADALGVDADERARFAAMAVPARPATATETTQTTETAETAETPPAVTPDAAPGDPAATPPARPAATDAPAGDDPAVLALPAPDTRPGGRARARLAGRDAELARLLAAWTQRTRVVILSGEAGIGKTRLAGELADRLVGDATVLWGRCTQHRVGVYEPFAAALRPVVEAMERGGRPVGQLGRLLPELAGHDAGSDGSDSADPEVERRLLFESVAGLLLRLGPVLLVLDDIQWADAGTLALLAHLAADGRLTGLCLLCTVRSTEHRPAMSAALTDLRRVAAVERIALARVDADAVIAMVRELAGPGADRYADAIVAATDGNPLFVEELTEHLATLGEAAWPGPHDGPLVPTSVQSTIGSRVTALSADAQALVRAGSVLGRTFDPLVAAHLAGLGDDAALAAVEDALLSGLVTEQSARELAFSHGVVQSAVYARVSGVRRLDLHRRAAIALAERATANATPTYAIAHHWATVAASDPTAAAPARAWALRAGDDAAAAADTDEAIARYTRAADWSPPGSAERADALLRLGSVLTACSRYDAADTALREVLVIADALGDPVRYARAAIGLASTVRYGHSDPERIGALQWAIDGLPSGHDVLRTMAAAMLKRQLGFDLSDDAYHRRQEAARLVLDAVSQPELPRELLLTLGTARDAIMVDDPVVLDRLSRATVTVGAAERRLHVVAHGWYGRAWSALELADADGWREATEGFTTVAHALSLPFELALASTMAATTALIAGRYDDVSVHAAKALELGRDADPNAIAINLTPAVMTGLDLGHGPAMVEVMAAARAELEHVPTFLAGFAMTAAHAGATEIAIGLVEEQAAPGFDAIRRDLEWLPVVGFLAFTVAALDAEQHAATLYRMLRAHPARAVRIGPLAGWWGPVDHHLGGLQRVLGSLPAAEAHQRTALDVARSMGSPPWIARACLELARVLDLQGERHRAEADDRRAEGLEIAAALGAVGISALATS